MAKYPSTWAYTKGQLTANDLAGMSPEEQAAAGESGRLDQMAGAPPRPPAKGQLTRADLGFMTPDQIAEAADRGQLDRLLGVATDEEIHF
ncbi:hypothetical protein [Streptomyces virginiae]|uniref:hypothetical protein n=1 Tax=Streptomyces virginiae TaxID=1961 RepID=UPI00324A2F55